MSDLARLGMRVESEEVAIADKRLDEFTGSAERAERAADGLSGGSKRASSAMLEMLAAIQKDIATLVGLQQAINGAATSTGALTASSKQAKQAIDDVSKSTKAANDTVKLHAGAINDANAHVVAFINNQKAVKAANDNAAKSSRVLQAAGLNLSRQFSDVGVSLASGINPLMVLIQQGPQIADGFQVASAAGLSFKTVVTGLYAEIAPLIATFAPWIAGLAAVGAGVWALVHAHEEHIKRIDAINASIGELHKKLSDATPWLFETTKQSNLAAEGTKNFNAWVEKNTKSLAGYADALRNAAIEEARMNVFKAKNDQQKLVDENFRVAGGVPTYRGKGSGPFGWVTGDLDKGYKEFEGKFKEAGENVKAATETLNAMLDAPKSAFKDLERTRKETKGELARDAAIADGRYATGPSNDRGVHSIDVQTIKDTPKDLFVSKGGLNDFNSKIDGNLNAAKEAAKDLADFEERQRRARVSAEARMWDDLTSLQSSGNKKLAAIGRAAAIAQATMDTYAAATASYKALAGIPIIGPALGAAAAAAAIAAGVANIGHIAGVKGFKDGGWTGNGATDQISGVTHGQEFVVKAGPAAANRAMLEAMNTGRPVAPPARPEPPPSANLGGMSVRVIKGDLFDVIVDRRAAAVAAPMAARARDEGAETAMAGAADQFTRRNVKALR